MHYAQFCLKWPLKLCDTLENKNCLIYILCQIKLHENPVSGSEVVICVQTDGQNVLNGHCAKT